MRCNMCGSVLDKVERRRVRAISLKQPWASMIAEGRKSIETRKWATTHRGEILRQAEANGRLQIEGLLRSLGFTDTLLIVRTE